MYEPVDIYISMYAKRYFDDTANFYEFSISSFTYPSFCFSFVKKKRIKKTRNIQIRND